MSTNSVSGTSRRAFVVSGVAVLLLLIAGEALAVLGFIRNIGAGAEVRAVLIMMASAAFTVFLVPGFFLNQPKQARVLTLFGEFFKDLVVGFELFPELSMPGHQL